MIKVTECPRDAMQGIVDFIPTEKKIAYIQSLLEVGFDSIDFSSFVSPKAIPQMVDAHEVTKSISKKNHTKLLAIVANEKGFDQAASYDKIDLIGYPLSISETFQMRNTNKNIQASYDLLDHFIAQHSKQELVVYISMAFGNPYSDPWSVDLVLEHAKAISDRGIRIISLADTIGSANPKTISSIFKACTGNLPQVEFGAHFHSRPEDTLQKIEAAYAAQCRSFDAALLGFGGCPFADDQLVGNINSEILIQWMQAHKLKPNINMDKLNISKELASEIFSVYK